MDPSSLQAWYYNVPVITKFFFMGTLLSGALLAQRIVSPADVVLDWSQVRDNHQYWRLLTSFFYGGPAFFSIGFAIHLFMVYENCRRYEETPFDTGGGGTSADFLWMLAITLAPLLILSYFFHMHVLSEVLVFLLMYTWSRRTPQTVVNIGPFPVKALYVPFINLGIRLLLGGTLTEPLLGMGVGHLFYFLAQVLPQHGIRLVRTPLICDEVVAYATGRSAPRRGVYRAAGRA
mmetsp:Transcript_4414/g.9944  ORF Transcript_4414/g.9944 Transcript_4414/m.9944 type:complete len:233 (+) Transcript_4414:94-792(+)